MNAIAIRTAEFRTSAAAAKSAAILDRIAALPDRAHPKMSQRYLMTSTKAFAAVMQELGFIPTAFSGGRNPFAVHVVTFTHLDYVERTADVSVGDIIPTINLVNSYDGTKPLCPMSGAFRLVCSNGMIVPYNAIPHASAKIKHLTCNRESILSAIRNVIGHYGAIVQDVNKLTNYYVSVERQDQYIRSCFSVPDEAMPRPGLGRHLNVRGVAPSDRWQPDRPVTAWGLYQLAHSARMHGGVAFPASPRSTSPLKAASGILKENERLWTRAVQLANGEQLPRYTIEI